MVTWTQTVGGRQVSCQVPCLTALLGPILSNFCQWSIANGHLDVGRRQVNCPVISTVTSNVVRLCTILFYDCVFFCQLLSSVTFYGSLLMDDHQVAVRVDGNHKHTTKGDNIHMLLIRCRYRGDNCFHMLLIIDQVVVDRPTQLICILQKTGSAPSHMVTIDIGSSHIFTESSYLIQHPSYDLTKFDSISRCSHCSHCECHSTIEIVNFTEHFLTRRWQTSPAGQKMR